MITGMRRRQPALLHCIAAAALLPLALPTSGAELAKHWAFQPPSRPQVPPIKDYSRTRTPIDAFVLAKLVAKGLGFAPDADRATLLRRVYLDLTGLPPSLEEAAAFLADNRPDAYERLLDQFLASPRFGERWGRHWLDVAGYTDTTGFDQDTNTILQPEGKWRYRDYVIAALNADMPYDRFVTEQLAGDELTDWRHAPRFTPEIRRLLTATGFLRTARDQTHEPESNIPLNYYGVLHDTVGIVGNSLLGLTLACAQCHDHKFDPIAQREYYQLMAVFTPAYNPKDWRPVYPWKAEIKDRGLPDASPAELAEIDRRNRDIDRRVAELKQAQSRLRTPHETRLREARVQRVPEPIRDDTRAAFTASASARNEIQKYLVSKFEGTLRVKPEEIAAALTAAERAEIAETDKRIATELAGRHTPAKIQALYDVGPPPPTFLLKRGEYETPGEEIQPGFLRVLSTSTDTGSERETQAVGRSSGRRLALAGWLTKPDSRAAALLSRVMVNRLWQHLLGKGLVASPENFGVSGEAPTHPELLEWLASEFAQSGWRVKGMLKQIMTSTVYRQSSQSRAEGENADPEDRLLWRMRLRRLEAEVIRDALLAVSDRLDPTMGGPAVIVRARPDGFVDIDDKERGDPAKPQRRSVYLLCRRSYNLSLLTLFDLPLVAQNCPSRSASAVPLQSLTMLNDVFVTEQARHYADRVNRIAGCAGEAPVTAAFRLALARVPTTAEMDICTRLLRVQSAAFRQAGKPAAEADRLALKQLCHAILNTSEFLYAE